MGTVLAGTWVQIHKVVLKAGERSPNVPEETSKVPFEMRVKGFLLHDAGIGDRVKIRTVINREIEGTLLEANPIFLHTFGAPVPELLHIGEALRGILKGETYDG